MTALAPNSCSCEPLRRLVVGRQATGSSFAACQPSKRQPGSPAQVLCTVRCGRARRKYLPSPTPSCEPVGLSLPASLFASLLFASPPQRSLPLARPHSPLTSPHKLLPVHNAPSSISVSSTSFRSVACVGSVSRRRSTQLFFYFNPPRFSPSWPHLRAVYSYRQLSTPHPQPSAHRFSASIGPPHTAPVFVFIIAPFLPSSYRHHHLAPRPRSAIPSLAAPAALSHHHLAFYCRGPVLPQLRRHCARLLPYPGTLLRLSCYLRFPGVPQRTLSDTCSQHRPSLDLALQPSAC